MVIVGLLILLAAIGIGLSGVLANSGSEHLLGQDFSVLGLQEAARPPGSSSSTGSSSGSWGCWG